MSPRHAYVHVALLAVAAATLVGCASSEGEPRPTRRARLPASVCGFLPGWAAAELLGSRKVQETQVSNELAGSVGGDARFRCVLTHTEEEHALFLTIELGTMAEFYSKGLADRGERRAAPSGRPVRTPLGDGTAGPYWAWVYPTCNGQDYYTFVHAPDDTPGSRKAVRALVVSVVDVLAKKQRCADDSGS